MHDRISVQSQLIIHKQIKTKANNDEVALVPWPLQMGRANGLAIARRGNVLGIKYQQPSKISINYY